MKEKAFENKIKNYLKSKGVYFVKFFANSYTRVGVPDLLACVNGRFVGIEVKAENGKPSQLQLVNKRLIEEAGGISLIVYPDDFDSLVELIERMLN